MTPQAETARPTPEERVRALAERLQPYHLRYEAARDPRAVFAFVYYNVTVDLAERLAAPDHGFADPGWVADLGVAFGRRFLAAMDALDEHLAGRLAAGEVPRPWLDVHEAIRDGRSYVLEDLVFSMMAHISFDLPHAVLDLPAGGERLADYHRMNSVLADKMEFIQEQVAERYQRWLGKLDRLAGSFDEFLTNYGIRGARSVAYYNSQRLLEASSAEAARGSIERSTRAFIESVRRPSPPWLAFGIRVLRWIVPRRRRWPEPPPEPPEAAPPAASRWQEPSEPGEPRG